MGKVQKPKKEIIKCKGITKTLNKCDRYPLQDTLYCLKHEYFNKLTAEQIKSIINKDGKFKSCGKCNKWHNEKSSNCLPCLKINSNYANNNKTNKVKCLSINPNGVNCTAVMKNKTDKYCKNHSYMAKYTSDQLKNMSACKCCHRMIYLESTNLSCDKCLGRKNKSKTKTDNIIKCKFVECSFQKSNGNEYCGVHQINVWKDHVEQILGKKVCKQYIGGCKAVLDLDYVAQNCISCVDKERAKNIIRRERKKELSKARKVASKSTNIDDDENSISDLDEDQAAIVDENIKQYMEKVLQKHISDSDKDEIEIDQNIKKYNIKEINKSEIKYNQNIMDIYTNIFKNNKQIDDVEITNISKNEKETDNINLTNIIQNNEKKIMKPKETIDKNIMKPKETIDKKEYARIRQQNYRKKQAELTNKPVCVKLTVEEKREHERLRKQVQRAKAKENKPVRVNLTVEEKREHERLRKQVQRAKAKGNVNKDDE
jgi:hypothetical protein